MISTAIIVFREVLEAALIITILMAATRGVLNRGRWISGGVAGGVIGAFVVALFMGAIANSFEGMGQEIFNAVILLTAVCMLAWHNIWMASHAKELTTNLKHVGHQINEGTLPLYSLAIASGLAVLREGSEVVLFLYGIAAGGSSNLEMLSGGIAGLFIGAITGALLYFGMLRIPPQWLFKTTSWLILLMACGLASSAAGYLSQAGVLPSQIPLWNSDGLLSEKSILGELLHILIGYESRPTALQLSFYLATLVVITSGMIWANRSGTVAPQTRSRGI
ncbi:FTR1 family iron permease [Gynuella sunshinyii]|uniref:High-affinity Fe2+/Pb2+ permease n=1 Tax=Gynuella sunshinyii YC6258 TaxID=1445510 RepID=A0A0C5UYP5_9GAMM|nr:FTR1 family protein [Gynuella sunshinyii]AJQ92440.1 high-affinity Fe2+/Pb2+ permease [Gynuella sunshinyii YC6258]